MMNNVSNVSEEPGPVQDLARDRGPGDGGLETERLR